MSDRSDSSRARRQLIERLRGELPEGTEFVCGYLRNGPPGYDRVFDPAGTSYVDVPQDRIRARHPVPPRRRQGEEGTVLVVEPGVKIDVKMTRVADLLTGPILVRLGRLPLVAKCWMWWSRTPRHHPHSPWG